jgi:hypothetical protein
VLEPVVAGDGIEYAGNGLLRNRALAGAIPGTRVVRAQIGSRAKSKGAVGGAGLVFGDFGRFYLCAEECLLSRASTDGGWGHVCRQELCINWRGKWADVGR